MRPDVDGHEVRHRSIRLGEAGQVGAGEFARGLGGAPLAFDGRGRQRACAAIAPVPVDGDLVFSVGVESGALRLRDVQLYDHVQYGGLYDLDGRPAALLEPVQRMNRDFRGDAARCD